MFHRCFLSFLILIIGILQNARAQPAPPPVTKPNQDAGKENEKAEKCSGNRTLQSVHGTFLRANSGNEWKASLEAGPAKEWDRWTIEKPEGATGNEVLLKVKHEYEKYLRANGDGSIDLNNRKGKLERWTVENNTDGSCSFRSVVHGLWLSSKDNTVKAVLARESTEHFWPASWKDIDNETKAPDFSEIKGKQIILSFRGTYLSADVTQWKVYMNNGPAKFHQTWQIDGSEKTVKIKAMHTPLSGYLRTDTNGYVDLTPHGEIPKEALWEPFKNDNDSWSFRNNATKQWLNANDNGAVKTVADRDIWDNFWLEKDEP